MNAQVQEGLKRWPLAAQPNNRSESWLKDARLVNAYVEKDPNTGEWMVQKRVGYVLQNAINNGWGSGIYGFGVNTMQKDVYSISSIRPGGVLQGSMYKNGVLFGTAGGLDGSSLGIMYDFIIDQNTTNPHLVFASPLNLYYTTGVGGWTQATLPSHGANIRGLAYLDQTIYFMDNLGQIFGSGFNDPSTWNALTVVIANSIPGFGVKLTSQLNYVIAFKSESMEVFYDSGTNTPPASPLAPVPGGISNYGALLGTVQQIDDIILFATSNRTVSPQIMRMDNLQTRRVSSPAIERLLDPFAATPNVNGTIWTWTFKHGGHRFYGLSVYAGSQINSFTVVYDIDENMWYQWTDPLGSFWPVAGMASNPEAQHVLQGWNDGNIYQFEGGYEFPTDNGVVASVEIYTPRTDFGTQRRKTLDRIYFRGDKTPGSVLYVSRNDADYDPAAWSIPRRVDLSKRNPYLDREGTFTRRAYHFKHMTATDFRLKSADLQMRVGTI